MRRFFNTLFLVLSGGLLMAQTSKDDCTNDRAYLGIYTNPVSDEKAELLNLPNTEGSLITEVLVGGAADRAGLQPFDYIFGIDDYRTDIKDDLTDLLSKYKAGTQATVHLIRNKQPLAINLIFGRQSDSIKRKRDEDDAPFLGISQRGDSDDEPGVSITVIANSTAKEMGLKSGDKINMINGHPIVDWADVTTAINMLEVGDPISVDFVRGGIIKKGTAVIKSHEETYDQDEHYQEVEYAFLGIESEPMSKTKAHKLGFDNPYGSYVSRVIPHTAAQRAGIQPFDYIYGVDEYRTGEGQELTHILRKFEVGDRSTIHFVRKSQDRQVQVTFGSREQNREIEKDECEGPFLGIQASHTYVERTGVSVDIVPNSTALSLGMQNGDLITRINDYPMIDWKDIGTAINNMDVGETIKVVWVRNGREMSGSKPILSYCDTKTNQIVYQERVRTAKPDWSTRSVEPLDLAKVEVIVSDLNRDEAGDLKRRYNIDLNLDNAVGMNSIRIATHPDKGVFQLSFNLPNRGQTTVRIYNNAGRPIYIYDIGTFSGKFSDDVDLSQNGVGTYYLQVEQNGKSASKRLLVQKG